MNFKTLFFTLILISTTSICQAEVIFQDTNGKSTPFSSLKGKWVFINYWASWCDTCVEEIPELNQFYQRNKDKVALFAVNYDAPSLREQKSLIKSLNIHYPSLIKDPGRQLNLGDINGVPMTFVFDPKGKLVKRMFGGQRARSLEKIIK